MTKLGKIFTAILLGLSVMFFGVAIVVNATHVDYDETLNDPTLGLKAIAQREQKRVSELTEMVAKQKEEIVIETSARRAALASLQVQMEQLEFELAQKESEYAQKRTELTQTRSSPSRLRKKNKRLEPRMSMRRVTRCWWPNKIAMLSSKNSATPTPNG